MTATLETVFRRIADTRMAGLPILNPALTVEAIGFRDWNGERFGVLVTPWFMNLICLPGSDTDLADASPHFRTLPGGEFEFLASEEKDIGAFLSCSLISPMADFADMAAARAVAGEVMSQLFKTPDAPAPLAPVGVRARLEQPVSRRAFFSAFVPREPKP